jgi:predicted O-methyltransferase YrrM
MSVFDKVTQDFGSIKYMQSKQASVLRDIIIENGSRDLLEIGFFMGKSSAYMGAILEDRDPERRDGAKLVTIDLASARDRSPNITELLAKLDLGHRVEPIFAHRSATWEMQKMLSMSPRPQFDFCYYDGGHVWDSTGFGVVLVHMLLKPGGLLLLDDMDWTMAKSDHYKANPKELLRYSSDESSTPAVRRTWDLILPHLGFEHVREISDFGRSHRWGLARKVR